jgi:hypothetical protein
MESSTIVRIDPITFLPSTYIAFDTSTLVLPSSLITDTAYIIMPLSVNDIPMYNTGTVTNVTGSPGSGG